MAPREKWTDERLDDLNQKVNRGFADVKSEFADVRSEMREGFDRLDSRFDRLDSRFDRMQQTLIVGLCAVVGSIIGSGAF